MNVDVYIISIYGTIANAEWNESFKKYLQELFPQNFNFKIVTLRNPTKRVFECRLGDEELNECKDAEIIIADNNFIDQLFDLPKLKWVQCTYAGLDSISDRMKALVSRKGKPRFISTRFTGVFYGTLMAEYCLSYMIANARGFIDHHSIQPEKDWWKMKAITPKVLRTLDEVTVCIIGLGSIGKQIARIFRKHDVNVIGYSKNEKSEAELKEIGVTYFSTKLEDVLPKSDYIISILPQTENTIGLLNDKFHLCEQKPVFINLGRGSVISASEIIKALDNEWISRAVLDVFEEEPLPATSALWTHPKVLITPHVSARTESKPLALLFKENYECFSKGKELKYVIDWEKDY